MKKKTLRAPSARKSSGKPRATAPTVRATAKVRSEVLAQAVACVPTNWCDSLLTGVKTGIGQPPYDCRHIEKLLLGIAARLRLL